LNLAVQKGLSQTTVTRVLANVRRIVTYFRKSPLAYGVLKKKQMLLKIDQHQLTNDVVTRFVYVINRFLFYQARYCSSASNYEVLDLMICFIKLLQ
jgi:hypothetical protein